MNKTLPKILSDHLLGRYQHYKGTTYTVIAIARDSENLDEMVVYHDDQENFWVRPKSMFFATVLVDGVSQPRFSRVSATV